MQVVQGNLATIGRMRQGLAQLQRTRTSCKMAASGSCIVYAPDLEAGASYKRSITSTRHAVQEAEKALSNLSA
jgi:hypothetical protein